MFTSHTQATYVTSMGDMDWFLKVRADQFEQMRAFINRKVDESPGGLVMLTGDLNVNSAKPDNLVNYLRENMKEQDG